MRSIHASAARRSAAPRALHMLFTLLSAVAMARASSSEDTAPSWNVLLIASALPWAFGPYQQQLGILAKALMLNGHDVCWLLAEHGDATTTEKWPIHTPMQAAKQSNSIRPNEDDEHDYADLKILIDRQGFQTNRINQITRSHTIDVVITLKDTDSIGVQGPLEAAVSVLWFPNHFRSLDPGTVAVLNAFTHIVALSPGDAEMVSSDAAVPSRVNISFIPHAVTVPPDLTDADDESVTSPPRPLLATEKRSMRERLGLPADAYVVLVHSGNYDRDNRKAFDTALLAFRAFRARVPNAFLYLHAVSAQSIAKHTQHRTPQVAELNAFGVSLDAMIHNVGLPADSYRWDERVLPYVDALGLLRVADVLLVPSKTEGFCMPLLEAQLLGTPVVSTRFGAMAHNTRHGVAVPPLDQPSWLGRGFVATPDLSGVIDALLTVHRGLPAGEREEAQLWVAEQMSTEAVTTQFMSLIGDGLRTPPPRPTALTSHVAPPKPWEPPRRRKRANVDDAVRSTASREYAALSYEEWDMSAFMSGRARPSQPLLLIQPAGFIVDADGLEAKITQFNQARADVLFLQAKRRNGEIFPLEHDISLGKLARDTVMLIRTGCISQAVEAVARHGNVPLADVILAALSQAAILKYELKHSTGVVAVEAPGSLKDEV